jgi:hypothetical protein
VATHSFTVVLRGDGKQRIADDEDLAEIEQRARQAIRDSGALPAGVEVDEPPAPAADGPPDQHAEIVGHETFPLPPVIR